MSKENKPLSWCWTYFNRVSEKNGKGKKILVGYCKFYNARYVANATKMEKHLEDCKKVGAEARKQIDCLSKKASPSREPPKKLPRISPSADCAMPSSIGIKGFFDNISKENHEDADILLTRAFATSSASSDGTRWGTYAELVSSISANEACLKSAVWDASLPVDDVLRNLRVLLCSDEFFWPTLNRTKEILKPLADSITRIKGNEMDSRGAYKMIKKAFVDAKQAVAEGDLGGPLQQEILELRNRVHVDTVSQVVYIKHNLMLEYAHLFKLASDEEAEVAQEELVEKLQQENEDVYCSDDDMFILSMNSNRALVIRSLHRTIVRKKLFEPVTSLPRTSHAVLRWKSDEASAESQPPQTSLLQITPAAVAQLKKVARDGEHLRIYVDSGGCSGFEYKLKMDGNPVNPAEDVLIEEQGAVVVVDKLSLDFIKGSKLDFVQDLMRSAFRITENPLSTQGCSSIASKMFSRIFLRGPRNMAPLAALSWMVTIKDLLGIEKVQLDKDPIKNKIKQSMMHRKIPSQ
uniref:FeS cluster biogenesis domain-containing protein n=1 Tax=Ditylenchus dipsaci TaxID=166011 RepID=A0A915DZE5_9BILA